MSLILVGGRFSTPLDYRVRWLTIVYWYIRKDNSVQWSSKAVSSTGGATIQTKVLFPQNKLITCLYSGPLILNIRILRCAKSKHHELPPSAVSLFLLFIAVASSLQGVHLQIRLPFTLPGRFKKPNFSQSQPLLSLQQHTLSLPRATFRLRHPSSRITQPQSKPHRHVRSASNSLIINIVEVRNHAGVEPQWQRWPPRSETSLISASVSSQHPMISLPSS